MRQKFFLTFLILEVIVIILYGLFVELGPEAKPDASAHAATKQKFQSYYPFFQDVHVMIYVGFGFLMVFLKKHSWSAVGLNFLVAVWSVQIFILFHGFWHNVFKNHWENI
jgi:ammonium transporter Rh